MVLKTRAHEGLVLAILIAMAGCEEDDKRLAELAERATAQQARQNEYIVEQSQAVARQSQELASAAHDLVDKDASARRDLIQAHEKLQGQIHVERTGINRQHEELHAERKSLAAAAVREPLIAQAILAMGLLLAALLPLLVTAYAIRRLPEPSTANELLVDGLLEDLLQPGAVGQDSAVPGLPGPAAPRLRGPDESPPPTGSGVGI